MSTSISSASTRGASSEDAALGLLLEQEQGAILNRRRTALPQSDAKADITDTNAALPRVGLAISGGGIRSATFGLGLLRGLAQQGVLSRLDYLSTVSGGGFIGAMFGRLVSQLGITQAQALLARRDSAALDWLRRNGRYLTPSGARDLGTAAVTYIRAFLAIHFESLLACIPFAVLVMAPHLFQQSFANFEPVGWQTWHTLWWPLALAFWLVCAPGAMTAYWAARDTRDSNLQRTLPPARDLLFLLVFGVVVVFASATVVRGMDHREVLRGQGASLLVIGTLLVLWSCLAGLVYTPLRLLITREKRALATSRLRNLFTRQLRVVTFISTGMAALGALDVLSWWLLEALQNSERWIQVILGLGGAGVVALRGLLLPLLRLAEASKAKSKRNWGPTLINLAGLFGLLALLCAWLVAAQWLVFTVSPFAALTDYAASVRALALLGVGCAWWLLSARNEQMANASSLHSFYRARLTRAYLAVGNKARNLLASLVATPQTSVTEVVPNDDLDMRDYQPEAMGGPIHLVNACLNQTRDDASGLYNADRKGALLTVSSRAIEVGTHDAVAFPARGTTSTELDTHVGTLGRWVAISGAATAPGAGSYTSIGWALLMFFLGLRLGYWMRSPHSWLVGCKAWRRRVWTWAVKPLMLWSEVSASFYGRARPWWYLSDGGHFENTGVYALLKRRLDFIIVADNSADADYKFGDLENLIRKARVDLGAEIDFYTREQAARHFPSASDQITVISPDSVADDHSVRGVMLARVRYAPAQDGTRPEATLLIIKPKLHDALDLDLQAYARRHPAFPHESTADQNFDESQWESYQRLGEDFGRALNPDWLQRLPGWSVACAHPMTVGARLSAAPRRQTPPTLAEPLWRRSASSSAIGTTLSLGASGTLLLAMWQVTAERRQTRIAEQAEVRQLFTEASRDLRDLNGACPKVADHTAAQLTTLRDMRESARLSPLELAGVSGLIEHVREECAKPTTRSDECLSAARRAQGGVCAVVNKPPAVGTALSYWHPAPAARVTLASLLSPAPPAPPNGSGPETGTVRYQTKKFPFLDSDTTLAKTCERTGHAVLLYVHIYDEASRAGAGALARLLQKDGGGSLQVAPVENVTRSAELRQRSRPIPWPQPTLIVHDPALRLCAQALSRAARNALSAQGQGTESVWVRDLPKSLPPSRGVIELWIPPLSQELAGQR